MINEFNLKIGGPAGEGIKVSGLAMSRALTRMGFSTFSYGEYPSLIRGGHNTYQLHASLNEVHSQIKRIDILIALDLETINRHQGELDNNSLIIYDPNKFSLLQGKYRGHYLALELQKIAVASGGQPIMANTVALGACFGFLGLPIKTLSEVVAKNFSDKPVEITNQNIRALNAGWTEADTRYREFKLKIEQPKEVIPRVIMSGNEAAALGAISAGLHFYVGYPMTPATSILHYLADKAKKVGVVVKHTEDEISAVNMAVGAGFAGARSMTGTSGSGLCLMVEGITLAGITETPLVVINSMRPGPAGGMPTWTGQGDLKFVINMGHDDFPRIVLAPGDALEAFHLCRFAIESAEKFQIPVIILLDKYISESDYSLIPFEGQHINLRHGILRTPTGTARNHKRYLNSPNGITYRTLPGTPNGLYCASSYEHDEFGISTEDGTGRKIMMDKRLRKTESIIKDLPGQSTYFNEGADLGIISWGSTKGPVLEVLKVNKNFNFLHLNTLWPFPINEVTSFITKNKQTVCVEGNATGQLGQLIREQTGLTVKGFLKYDGRPFYPEDIAEEIKKVRET